MQQDADAGQQPVDAAPAPTERDRRAAFFLQAKAQTPIVAVDYEGLRLLVSTADRGLGLRLFAKRRRREAKTLRRALRHLRARGLHEDPRACVLLDIGANIGTVCLVAVATGVFRRAVALEPAPENFALLRANAALNFLDDRIDAYPLAAAAAAGVVELAMSKRSSGGHRVRELASGPRELLEVEAVTLDGLLDRAGLAPEDIGLVWIDVNGLDADVLAGAERLLSARVPVVFEATPNPAPLPSLVRSYGRLVDLRVKQPDLPIDQLDAVLGGLGKGGREETDLLLLP
jgi:FkbM family methyltransferase